MGDEDLGFVWTCVWLFLIGVGALVAAATVAGALIVWLLRTFG
jgi:hypothetical protein